MTGRVETFGDLLRQLRIEAGLTQEELAERAAMSVSSVGNLERGLNRFPYRATVQRLIEVLQPADEDAAALRTLAERRRGPRTDEHAPSIHLPHPLTPLLGREREQAHLLHLLRWEGIRLLTLTGTGGVGKTRLALQIATEVAGDFADGAAFVSLASVDAPSLVPSAIVATLGIRPGGKGTPEESLVAHLGQQEYLLVLDNFEHVLEAGRFVAEMLWSCPKLKVLATSRAPLNLRGERQVEIGTLDIPPVGEAATPGSLIRAPATALFLQRAQAANAALSVTNAQARAIVEICRRLDGLPLAIELAAARVRYYPPQILLAHLDRGLEALGEGQQDLPVRQQTLRNTIEWSFRLLPQQQQALFRRLAVFVGGATIEAVAAVCGAGDPSTEHSVYMLRDASLLTLHHAREDTVRVRMLETVRTYALELLGTSEEIASVRDAHLAYYLALAEEAGTKLTGAEQVFWLARLEDEWGNLRAALQWAHEQHRLMEGLRLAIALRLLWEIQGPLDEAQHWLERFLAEGDESPATRDGQLYARGLYALGRVLLQRVDLDRAEDAFNRVLAPARQHGNAEFTIGVLNSLAGLAHTRNDFSRAAELYGQVLAIATAEDDRWFLAAVYTNLGNLASDRGDLEEACVYLEEGLRFSRELRETRVTGMNLNVLGEVYRLQDALERARATYMEALHLLYQVSDLDGLSFSLDSLGRIARDEGEYERAARLVGAGDRARFDLGAHRGNMEQAARDEVMAHCECALGHTAAHTAQQEGYVMSTDEAVAYALSDVPVGQGRAGP